MNWASICYEDQQIITYIDACEILWFPSEIKTDISPSEKTMFISPWRHSTNALTTKNIWVPDNEKQILFSNVLLP